MEWPILINSDKRWSLVLEWLRANVSDPAERFNRAKNTALSWGFVLYFSDRTGSMILRWGTERPYEEFDRLFTERMAEMD